MDIQLAFDGKVVDCGPYLADALEEMRVPDGATLDAVFWP
jgi:hypothetical protein